MLWSCSSRNGEGTSPLWQRLLWRRTCEEPLALSARGALQRPFCFPSLPRMINPCFLNYCLLKKAFSREKAQLFPLFRNDPWQGWGPADSGLGVQWWFLCADPEELGRAVQWECAWLTLLAKQERMPREAPKPSIQLVNIPATGNRDELQLVPKGEAQMSLCRSCTRAVICSCVCEFVRNASNT